MTREERAALKLIDDCWYQTSRKYCLLAKLPEGKSGVEALIDYATKHDIRPGDTKEWAEMLGEASAGDQFLRCTTNPQYKKTVDSKVFEAFRRLGGGTYGDTYLRGKTTPWLRG